MKKLLLSGLLALICVTAFAQNVYDKIFFTEYVVNGAQKALEIGNNSGAPVKLNRLGYRVHLNAVASTGAPVQLADDSSNQELPADSVFVLYHNTTTAPRISPTDMPNSFPGNIKAEYFLFNGNDAIELLYKDDLNVWHTADFFGAIGTDPGTEWVGGPLHTTGMSLSRKASVSIGLQQNPTDFTAVLISQWKANYDGTIPASGIFETLGQHSFSPFFIANSTITVNLQKVRESYSPYEYINYTPSTSQTTNTLKNYPLAAQFDEYGGNKNNKIQETPAGFFRTIQDGSGKWSMIDPGGYEFFSYGINAVKKPSTNTMNLPEELLDMHLNTLGGWSDASLINNDNGPNDGRKIPYTVSLDLLGGYANKKLVTGTSYTVYRVFGDDEASFRTHIRNKAALSITPERIADTYLIGYFSDNEIKGVFTSAILPYYLDPANYGTNGATNASYLFVKDWYENTRMGTAPTNPSTADRVAFYSLIAKIYYQAVFDAIRELDPNHLVMSSRLTVTEMNMPNLYQAMGPYIDVFTLNYYWAWTPNLTTIANWSTNTNKPVIITEFGAQARDVLNANNGTTNNPTAVSTAVFLVNGQQDRANFLEHYGMELLKSKYVVGFHWFKYLDVDLTNSAGAQATDWINRGLVNKNYKPYIPLKKTIDKLGRDIYNLRNVKLGTGINQTIAFTPLPASVNMGSANLPLYAIASTDLPVTFSSSNTAYAEIVNGNQLKINGPGLVTITASQAGDATNLVNAASTTQAIRIKAPQTITFQNTSKFIMEPDFSPATASSALAVTYTSSDPSKAIIVDNGTKIQLVSAGTVDITAKQAGNAEFMPASDVTRTLTISNSIALSPEADTYVQGGAYATTINGDKTLLDIKNDTNADWYRESFLRFDLSSLAGSTITAANLKMTTYSADGTPVIKAFGVINDTWTESSTNFNNKPTASATVLASATASTVAGTKLTFNLLTYIQNEMPDQKASICLKDNVANLKLVRFYSFQTSTAANRPVLEVTVTKNSNQASSPFDPGSMALSTSSFTESAGHNVIVYPNPASSIVSIAAPASFNNGTVRLYDVSGNLKQSGIMKNGTCEFKLANLAAGLYFVKIDGASASVVKKIIKE